VVAVYQEKEEKGRESERTAVALAAALKFLRVRIYTDVDGVYPQGKKMREEGKKARMAGTRPRRFLLLFSY